MEQGLPILACRATQRFS